MKRLSCLCLSLFFSANALAITEADNKEIIKTIADYFKYMAACPTDAKITTEHMRLASESKLDPKVVDPIVLPTDIEAKVKVSVCHINAHYYVWLRPKTDWFEVVELTPVTVMEKSKTDK